MEYKELLQEDKDFFIKYKNNYIGDVNKVFETLGLSVPDRIKLKKILVDLYDEIYLKPKEPEGIQSSMEAIIESDINRKLLIAVPFSKITINYLNYILQQVNRIDVNKLYAFYALQTFIFFTLKRVIKDLEASLMQKITQEFKNQLVELQSRISLTDQETFFNTILNTIKHTYPEVSTSENLQQGIREWVSESLKELTKENVNVPRTEEEMAGENLPSEKKPEIEQEFEEETEDLLALAQMENILSNLEYIKEIGGTLLLKSYYKGLPLECEAEIEDIDSESNIVYLRGIDCKFKVFYIPGNPVYIYHDIFSQPVFAKIFKADVEKGEIALRDFRYKSNVFDKRKSIRLEPGGRISAEVLKENESYIGLIKDISQSGARVIFPEDTDLKEGDLIRFRTIIGNINIDTPARVRKVEDNGRIIGIEFKLPYEEERKLSQYIMQLQQDILNEIKLP